MIPLHPQPCAGRPDQVRWILPAGTVPFAGAVAAAPAPLAALLADGTLAEVSLERGRDAVVTTIGPGRSWRDEGARVRTAVHTAAGTPDGWCPADAGDPADDEDPADDDALRAAAERLLQGSVGDLARSHGGTIELLDVHDGVLRVRLDGACHGCPAAGTTLQLRLEAELRRRCPGLRGVVAANEPGRLRLPLVRS